MEENTLSVLQIAPGQYPKQVEIAVHFDVTLDYLILGKVETKTELALSKKINDQKQAMKSLREQLLAFAMEIEVE